VNETLRREGQTELDRSSRALAWSALAAGLSIGLSMLAEAVLRLHAPEASWRPLKPSAHDPWTAFIKGIFGGWLIALMVWLLPSAEAARIRIIVALTYVLSVTQLTHLIAGSVEAFYLVITGELSAVGYLWRYGEGLRVSEGPLSCVSEKEFESAAVRRNRPEVHLDERRRRVRCW
jgi:formate/nitrite transporter FocA (FNT family)